MGWDSPIKFSETTSLIHEELDKQIENHTLQTIVNLGIDVDKGELIKALSYDRHQYEQGYSDGVAASFKDCVFEDGEYCWQKCVATEHCQECSWLGNGDTIWFEEL